MKKIFALILSMLVFCCILRSADYPKEINLGLTGNPYNKPFVSGAFGYAKEAGLFEKEFAKDGIKVNFKMYKGFGPAINEALANKTVDFGAYGDLCGVVSKAGGLKIYVLALTGGSGDTYIAVPYDSKAKSIEDLKGKKVALAKGTYMDLSFNKIIFDRGLKEKDFKIINLTAIDGLAALAGGVVDAQAGSSSTLELVRTNRARIIYSTAGPDAPDAYRSFGEIVVREDFEKKYPDIVKRVIKVIAQANLYITDEKNREKAVALTLKTGVPEALIRKELGNKSLRWVYGLSIDKDAVARLKETVKFVKDRGMIRKDIDVDEWVKPQYLTEAYGELGVKNSWSLPISEHYIK
jgi:sulfonate transport system substrate-binding protein